MHDNKGSVTSTLSMATVTLCQCRSDSIMHYTNVRISSRTFLVHNIFSPLLRRHKAALPSP